MMIVDGDDENDCEVDQGDQEEKHNDWKIDELVKYSRFVFKIIKFLNSSTNNNLFSGKSLIYLNNSN